MSKWYDVLRFVSRFERSQCNIPRSLNNVTRGLNPCGQDVVITIVIIIIIFNFGHWYDIGFAYLNDLVVTNIFQWFIYVAITILPPSTPQGALENDCNYNQSLHFIILVFKCLTGWTTQQTPNPFSTPALAILLQHFSSPFLCCRH